MSGSRGYSGGRPKDAVSNPAEVPPKRVRSSGDPTDDGGAYLPICGPCIRGEGSECHTPGCALWMRDVPPEGLIAEFALAHPATDPEDAS